MEHRNPQTDAEWFEHYLKEYRTMSEAQILAARKGWKIGTMGYEAAQKALSELREKSAPKWSIDRRLVVLGVVVALLGVAATLVCSLRP
jgi:hypothetical protein